MEFLKTEKELIQNLQNKYTSPPLQQVELFRSSPAPSCSFLCVALTSCPRPRAYVITQGDTENDQQAVTGCAAHVKQPIADHSRSSEQSGGINFRSCEICEGSGVHVQEYYHRRLEARTERACLCTNSEQNFILTNVTAVGQSVLPHAR